MFTNSGPRKQGSGEALLRKNVNFHYVSRIAKPLLAVALSLVSGCGLSKSAPPRANLEGIVTLDGRPLSEGTMQFMPQVKGQAPPSMAVIAEGRYVAAGVPKGKVRVLLNATKKT